MKRNPKKLIHCECIREIVIQVPVVVPPSTGKLWSTKRQKRIISFKKGDITEYYKVRADKNGTKRFAVRFPKTEWDRTGIPPNGNLPLRYSGCFLSLNEFLLFFRIFSPDEEKKLLTFKRFDL